MLRQLRYLLLIFLTATTGAVHAQDVLPRPEEPFAGKIGFTYKDSEPVKPKLRSLPHLDFRTPPTSCWCSSMGALHRST